MEEDLESKEREKPSKLDILTKNRDPALQAYTIKFKNGATYYGCCKGRVPHGFGKKTSRSGSWYEGDWVNGVRHGCGKAYNPRTRTTYDGEWRRNERSGEGSEETTNLGNTVKYTGRWANNRRHGNGTVEWSNGRVVEALWENGTLVRVLFDNAAEPPALGCLEAEKARTPEYALLNLTTEDFEDDDD